MHASRVTEHNGEPMPRGTWAILVSPVMLGDGRRLMWHPPQPVAFSLAQAKAHCDRAVPKRRRIMGNLVAREHGDGYVPQNARAVLDVVADLWSAVLHSFTAIEAIANDSIDRLPDDATVTIGKKGDTREIAQPDMVRRLSLDEKLRQAVPMLRLDGLVGRNIVGTRPWERYVHLKKLRDDLVHVKARGYSPDEDTATAYDRLLLGDADTCATDAFEIVQALRPGFLDADAIEHLSR